MPTPGSNAAPDHLKRKDTVSHCNGRSGIHPIPGAVYLIPDYVVVMNNDKVNIIQIQDGDPDGLFAVVLFFQKSRMHPHLR